MNIELKKYGTTLVFRDRGEEAYKAFLSNFVEPPQTENVLIDFAGVTTFSPSWGDEFLTPLSKKYKERLLLKKTDNPSVRETLDILTKVKELKFNFVD